MYISNTRSLLLPSRIILFFINQCHLDGILWTHSIIFEDFQLIMQEQDQLRVEDTNQQALASKISAAKLKYFNDPYAEQFTQYRGKRDIIIHRGYWARVQVVRRLIETMIQHGQNVQIVSVGSGLDTVWFNLMAEGKIPKPFRFIELDLESVIKKKIRKINHSKKLAKLFQNLNLTPHVSQHQHLFKLGEAYTLAACDISKISEIQQIIHDHKIDPTVPTLFYSECVLSYVDAEDVDKFVGYIAQTFNLAFFFDYEMYNPLDRFGELMVKNFQLRGCPLIGIGKYPKLEDQKIRYDTAGFKNTEVYNMLQIYRHCIPAEQRQRIEKIEMLDEFEEWNLIMSHYFGLLSVTYNAEGEKHPSFAQLVQNMHLRL